MGNKVHWIKTAEFHPEPNVDVLTCFTLGEGEMHVMAITTDGEWYRQMEDGEKWAAPEYWAELPESPVYVSEL